jgi:hypothetical protein
LGGAGVGNITYGFGETLRDEPGGGRICCAERRGDRSETTFSLAMIHGLGKLELPKSRHTF